MKAGREDARGDGLDGHSGVPVGEVNGRIRDMAPSVVFSCVVSVWALEADPDVPDVDGLSADWFEQPLMTATGAARKAMAAVTCLIIGAAYPYDACSKLEFCSGKLSRHRKAGTEKPVRDQPHEAGCRPSGWVTTSAPHARNRS